MLNPDPPERSSRAVLRDPGGQLEPFGELAFIELAEYFARRAAACRGRGARRLLADGMPSLGSARAALLGARAAGLSVTVTLELREDGRTRYGSDPAAALVTLQALGAEGFGFSDGSDPQAAREALDALEDYAQIPLLPFPPGADGPPLVPGRAPKLGGIVAACESGVFLLGDTCEFSEPVPCALEMADDILEVEDNSNDVLLVRVDSPDDAHSFSLNSHMARLPVAFSSDREDALEMALALYHGRALIDSMSDLPRGTLERLAGLYGATVV